MLLLTSSPNKNKLLQTRFGRVLGVLLLRQGASKQLVQLENRLSDGEVAQFRWWTWATWYKRRRVSSSTLLFLLAACTDSQPVSQQLDNTAQKLLLLSGHDTAACQVKTQLLCLPYGGLSCSVLVYLPSRLLPNQQAGSLTCDMEEASRRRGSMHEH